MGNIIIKFNMEVLGKEEQMIKYTVVKKPVIKVGTQGNCCNGTGSVSVN